jgi:L-fucose isomerase-like protein
MKNIDDPIIIDVFAAFTDFVSAGRTVRDLFGNRLVTFGAESHIFFDNIAG